MLDKSRESGFRIDSKGNICTSYIKCYPGFSLSDIEEGSLDDPQGASCEWSRVVWFIVDDDHWQELIGGGALLASMESGWLPSLRGKGTFPLPVSFLFAKGARARSRLPGLVWAIFIPVPFSTAGVADVWAGLQGSPSMRA